MQQEGEKARLSSFAASICRAQCAILGNFHGVHSNRIWQPRANPVVDESSEIFAARNQLSVCKLGNVDVDVSMIEPIPHFIGKDRVENQVTVEVTTRRGKKRWAVIGRICPGCGSDEG